MFSQELIISAASGNVNNTNLSLRVDASGNLINENGDLIDSAGNLIDASGNLIDASGNIIDNGPNNGSNNGPNNGPDIRDEYNFCELLFIDTADYIFNILNKLLFSDVEISQ